MEYIAGIGIKYKNIEFIIIIYNLFLLWSFNSKIRLAKINKPKANLKIILS